jgi:exosortase/archaeosortase family protein
MVVGSSCAGVNFLVICLLCLYFSFATRVPNKARWLLYSGLISFAGTIAANGLRIVVSARLWSADIYGGEMTPELVHRLVGVAIYYASLLSIYLVVESRIGQRASTMAPLAWYLGISLGIPLAGRVYGEAPPGFVAHAAWVLTVALLLTLIHLLVKALPYARRNRLHCKS